MPRKGKVRVYRAPTHVTGERWLKVSYGTVPVPPFMAQVVLLNRLIGHGKNRDSGDEAAAITRGVRNY